MVVAAKKAILLSTLVATFSTGMSDCNGGHMYLVFNALPPATGLTYLARITGYKPRITCIALCNTVSKCLSVFYNETSSTCYLNDHTTYSVSQSATDLTFIGWKTRCDYNGECQSSDMYTCDDVVSDPTIYTSCREVGQSGVYYINPDGGKPFRVRCLNIQGGPYWTVILNRQDPSINFTRGWNEYKNGFGNPQGSYWLGSDRIHRITSARSHKLAFNMRANLSTWAVAYYSYVKIWDEARLYRLELGAYVGGNAGDSLSVMAGNPFSTFDADNDRNPNINCALYYHGGWWYGNGTSGNETSVFGCQSANLNGNYWNFPYNCPGDGIIWPTFRGMYYSLSFAYMMIAPTDM